MTLYLILAAWLIVAVPLAARYLVGFKQEYSCGPTCRCDKLESDDVIWGIVLALIWPVNIGYRIHLWVVQMLRALARGLWTLLGWMRIGHTK